MKAKGSTCQMPYRMISSCADQACAIQNTWMPTCDSRCGTRPSSRNSHLMASAPTTGVMMKGSSEAAMNRPFRRCVTRFMASASTSPPPRMKGVVTSVYSSVKPSAERNSLCEPASRFWGPAFRPRTLR